jgi:hypothetical protein
VAVILFGVMAPFSPGGFYLPDLEARKRLGTPQWRETSAGTSVVPLAAMPTGRCRPVPLRAPFSSPS